jgi:hypothetical protein
VRVEPTRLRCTLVVREGGLSRRVGAAGVWIGRQRDCDIVAGDPAASRRHALVRLTSDGVEVVPLGRAPVEVNGKPHTKPHVLADGDELRVPGLVLDVAVTAPKPDADPATGFVLERPRGGGFGIAHTPFQIGGADADDLIVKKWPPHALVLHLAQDALFVEVRAGSAARNGDELGEGAIDQLVAGDELAYRGETFRIAYGRGHDTTTVVASSDALPRRVEIEMLPRGGRIVFSLPEGDRAVYLSDRRFDLIHALLAPPAGYRAGEFIPDDVVRSVVWPRKPGVSRPEINMLISRCRRDLLDIGLAGPRLLERAPGGGGTRFLLARDAEVVVRS